MPQDFSDILNSSKFASNQVQAVEHQAEPVAASKLSQFQDIFKASDDIWNRKQIKVTDRPSVSSIFSPKVASAPAAPSKPTLPSYALTSTQQVEELVTGSIDRTRMEAERLFLNQHILESNQSFATQRPKGNQIIPKDAPESKSRSKFMQPLDSYAENVFAKKIEYAIMHGGMPAVLPALMEAVTDLKDPALESLWDKIFAICQEPVLDLDQTIDQYRDSKAWMKHVTNRGTIYLQSEFKRYMQSTIESNLQVAQRGGVPGNLSLVEAYLNVTQTQPTYQTDIFRGHPVWCVLFHAIRIGDFGSAKKVTEALSNVPAHSIVISVINSLASGHHIEHSTRLKLFAEWNHEEARCIDPYMRAVYGVILDHDCDEVNNSIENWLWAKLLSAKLDTEHGLERFQLLQRTICAELGEAYFMDDRAGGNCSLYFATLILSGQVERAIEILQRSDLPVFASHFAILAYAIKLLIVTDKVSDNILVVDPSDSVLCKLNFARVIINYVKRFEMVNVSYALNYCFFLHKLQFETQVSQEASSLFDACVSRLAYVTGENDVILGRLAADGSRVPGLLDRFSKELNVNDVIAKVALDVSLHGDNLNACKIFCLAGRANDAVKLMNRQLSVSLTSTSKHSEAVIVAAEQLLKRYKDARNSGVEKQHLATLKTLIHCCNLAYSFNEKRYDDVLLESERLSIIPLDPDAVGAEVERFKLVPEEVRSLLPELSVILMETIVAKFKAAPVKSQTQQRMRQLAKAILLYSAMIPFRFPTAINSKLLQLQSQVS